MDEIARTWDDYYGDESRDTAIKDDSFFRLEVDELTRRVGIEVQARWEAGSVRLLELGSATGHLAETIVGAAPKDMEIAYTGVDLSEVACERASSRAIPGAQFEAQDFLSFIRSSEETYDIVVSQRSIMALLSRDEQLELLVGIRHQLAPGGVALLSEGSQQALERLNALRAELGVEAFERIWHSLYVDEDAIRQAFPIVEVCDFASLFWLLTRVVYPSFETPRHNSPLHRFSASLPQVGDFGLVKLFVARSE